MTGAEAAIGLRKRAFGGLIAKAEPRLIEQRREERYEHVVDRAAILFRGQEYLVPVLNISSRGTMIECDIVPRIGETIVIRFEHCSPIQGFVRWIREGRLGLNFGHEIILA
jgi:hypothetical protein